MSNSPIKRVSMLIIMQPDLEAAVKFYEGLGLAKKFHMEGKWAEFNLDGASLGLCPVDAKDLPERRTGFVLEVDDLKAFHQEHVDHIKFMNEPVEAPHGIMVSFVDPGGNIIDLYQPTPEKMEEFAKKAAAEKGKSSCCGGSCSDEG